MLAIDTGTTPTPGLSVRLAGSSADLEAVQRLRWQVFFAERGADAVRNAANHSDTDSYDALCDHLLVTDCDAEGTTRVVGTYRLLREAVATAHSGFYSAGEYDLAVLSQGRDSRNGELLELGRSCVLPAYRTSATIQLLWRGIAEYIARHNIALMFGCASFPGTDVAPHAQALSYLHHNHLAPPEMRPIVREGMGTRMDLVARGSYNDRRAMLALPPLVKGYLRVGAKFGEGAFIDHDFGTIDVFVVMPVALISQRYAARFNVTA
jgi:putative hemolysin